MPDFAVIYATFRGSKSFLVGLLVFIALWLSFHMALGFDKDFGMLNTILSTEASVSLAFFTMVSDAQAKAQQRQAQALSEMVSDIKRMGEALITMSEVSQKVLLELNSRLTCRDGPPPGQDNP